MLKNFLFLLMMFFLVSSASIFFNTKYIFNSIVPDLQKVSYDSGYKNGIIDTEKTLHKEYQNYIYALYDEKYDPKDVRQQIITEKRIEKIIYKSNPKLTQEKKNTYIYYIVKWAHEYNLSPVFVAAIIHRETNFRENSVSKSNARGCMQVIYKYHKDKCDKLGIKENDLHSINHGINIGCQVISQYLDWNDWNYRAALKKYVGSVNNSADGYIKDIFDMTMYAYSDE